MKFSLNSGNIFSIFKIQCFLVDFRGGEQQQDGEGADQHRDGARHPATEVGLHGPGENNQKNQQPTKKTKKRNKQPTKKTEKRNKQPTKKKLKTQTNNHTINQPTNQPTNKQTNK